MSLRFWKINNVKRDIGHYFKKLSPGRLISLSFASMIVLGSIVLMFPALINAGCNVKFIDALFTSTSAVCVTGLTVLDVADTWRPVGRAIVALLIQIGGLGVSSVGVGFIIAARKRVNFKERLLVKEALNVNNFKGLVKLVKAVLFMTLCFETVGMVLNFTVFVQDYPPLKALGISAFHSISAFNNAGFDIIGGFNSLTSYANNVPLNLITCLLIIFGGIGFLVILDIINKRSFKRLTLHSKIVIVTTAALLIVGTILLWGSNDISLMGAFFYSTSARTAGFATYNIGNFSNAGLLVLMALMFIGASPGSTGGGIKTTTFFSLLQATKSAATNAQRAAFKRKIPDIVIIKAFIVTLFASMFVILGTFLLCIFEKNCTFLQLFFEEVSAFGTVGLSTGITPDFCSASKIILIITMFAGRLGPVTIASLWIFKPDANVSYSEENIAIG